MKYVFHNIFVEFVDFFSLAVRNPTLVSNSNIFVRKNVVMTF